MRFLLLVTLVACSSPSSSPATTPAAPATPPAGDTAAAPAADQTADGWTCFDHDGHSRCRDSKGGCEYERDKVSGASACVRVTEAWCYEHGEEDDLGIREKTCVRTQAECASAGSNCEKETRNAKQRFDDLSKQLKDLEGQPTFPGASTPAASGYSCYEYYNKMAQLTDTICVQAARCEADQKAKLDTKLATNPTPCKPVPSVWCFPFAGSDTCVPSSDMCQKRRESRLRDNRSAANECAERRN